MMMITLFVLFCTLSSISAATNSLSTIVSAVMDRFVHCHVVFHVEANSFPAMTEAMERSISLRSFSVFSYDSADTGFHRPPAEAVLNLVLLEDIHQMVKYTNKTSSLSLYDPVVFFSSTPDLNLTSVKNLENAGVAYVVVHREGSDFAEVYSACFYCGPPSKKPILVSNSTLAEINQHFSPSHFRGRTNMNGHVFRLVFKSYSPFIWCASTKRAVVLGKENIVCADLRGSQAFFLEESAKRMNFTYFILHNKPPDSLSFDFMVEEVADKIVDFAVGGFSMIQSRMGKVAFTSAFDLENFVVVYLCRRDSWDAALLLLRPFSLALWMAYLSTIGAVAVTLYLISRVPQAEGTFGFAECFQVCLSSAVEQSSPYAKSMAKSSKILLVSGLSVLWMGTISLNAMYKGKLSSLLLNPPHLEPAELIEMRQMGYNFVSDKLNSAVVLEMLNITGSAIHQEILRELEEVEGLCSGLLKVMMGRWALLDERSRIEYQLKKCLKPGQTLDPRLRIASTPVRHVAHGWVLPPGAPFSRSFSRLLEATHGGGLFTKWIDDVSLESNFTKIDTSKDNTQESFDYAISLSSLLSPFLVYLIGIIAAAVCFVVEIFVGRKKKLC